MGEERNEEKAERENRNREKKIKMVCRKVKINLCRERKKQEQK